MDRLRGLGSSLVGAAGNMVDKSITQLKENYLNKVYDVGSRRVVVKKLIAEGGFGFVFQVKEVGGSERPYALKRMIVQDRERTAAIKNEVNLMKQLARQPHIVSLEDHKVTDMRTELEVLLLMEYCSCSLLDAMNQGRLRGEQDIYSVFSQICTAVALLHANTPPISHRDLKVENVLLGEDGRWKLCDFGSATTATYLPTTERERSVAEEDINRNTTMMYRAPEMVDLYRRQPINEKVDIWALGCVLYKMAYLVDAFDGGLGIMNARYTFPEFRRTTASFEEFIGWLLNPDPVARPNIQQVQQRLATLRGGTAVPQSSPSHTRPPPSNNPRPTSAPTQKPSAPTQKPTSAPTHKPAGAPSKSATDLIDWGENTTNHTATSSPSPSQTPHPPASANLHHSTPLPAKQSDLFDSLGWQTSSNTPNPTNTNPNVARTPNAKPTTPSKPAQSTTPTTKQPDVPDLLDFSEPTPKLPQYSAPPLATPTQYYSPQQQRAPYVNSHPTYYSPPAFHSTPHQPQQSPADILAKFALPKQQSTGGLEDFDLSVKPTTPPTLITSPTASSTLPPPKSRQTQHTTSADLINF